MTKFKVTTDDLIGELSGFPLEVVEKMLERQYQACGVVDVTVFQRDSGADTTCRGFTWSESPEGWGFWSSIINNRCFEEFFNRYPVGLDVNTREVFEKPELPMGKIEMWIQSRIKVPEAMSRIDRLRLLISAIWDSGRGVSPSNFIERGIDEFDWYPTQRNIAEASKLLLGAEGANLGEVSCMISNILNDIVTSLDKLESGETLYRSTIHLSSERSLRNIVNWILKNPEISTRLNQTRVYFQGAHGWRVTYIGRIDECKALSDGYKPCENIKALKNGSSYYIIRGSLYEIY